MQPVLRCEQVREIDRIAIQDLGMPGLVLMENAGRGVAEILLETSARRVLIACGPGNNGGDGFVIARHLDLHGIEVHVLLCTTRDRLRGDAAANLRWLDDSSVRVHQRMDEGWQEAIAGRSRFDWVVDAILGTGSHGPPRPPVDDVIRLLNQLQVRRLAVDIPSGLDADSGAIASPTFRADRTATFVAAKPGLLLPAAKEVVGELSVVGIGVPRGLLQRFDIWDR